MLDLATLALTFACSAAAQPWIPQQSGATVNLRGISAVSTEIAWASGDKGTYLHSSDGGDTWKAARVPGEGGLDFRGVKAIDERTVFLLSSGTGEKSRIYKTADAGANWSVLQVNPDPRGFWDAIAMWDPMHGIVLGDPVNGRFTIYVTTDGVTWQALKGPSANAGEGAFAASNSCLFVLGEHEAWFGTGGASGARVFHTEDNGKTWSVAKTPIRHDSPNAGIFSLAFSDARHGVAVGGDYMKADETRDTIAFTEDGGKTWTAASGPPPSYRSAVEYVRDHKLWLTVGPSGGNVSTDAKTWSPVTASYNALSFPWAVGSGGMIGRFE